MNVHQLAFDQRLAVLRYIAARHPNRIGRAELSKLMSGTPRTHQRTLKELVEAGYLECDQCSPAGYKFITGRFEEFQGL